MVLRALGSGLPGSGGFLTPCILGDGILHFALELETPVTFLAPSTEIDRFKASGGFRELETLNRVVDLGEKRDPRVEPARLTERFESKIVILRVRYSSAGKAFDSVTKLHQRLQRKHLSVVVMVGIPDDHFPGTVRRALRHRHAKGAFAR